MQVLAKIREQTMTRNIDRFLTGRNRREIQQIANRMSSHISGNYIQKPQHSNLSIFPKINTDWCSFSLLYELQYKGLLHKLLLFCMKF